MYYGNKVRKINHMTCHTKSCYLQGQHGGEVKRMACFWGAVLQWRASCILGASSVLQTWSRPLLAASFDRARICWWRRLCLKSLYGLRMTPTLNRLRSRHELAWVCVRANVWKYAYVVYCWLTIIVFDASCWVTNTHRRLLPQLASVAFQRYRHYKTRRRRELINNSTR